MRNYIATLLILLTLIIRCLFFVTSGRWNVFPKNGERTRWL